MSNNRIGGSNNAPSYVQLNQVPVAPTPTPSQAVGASTKAAPVNLFDLSSYAKSVNVADGAGSAISLPTLSDDQVAQAKALFSKVDDDKQGEVNAASQALGQALVQQMQLSPPAQLESSEPDGTVKGPSNLSRLATTPLGGSLPSGVGARNAQVKLASGSALNASGLTSTTPSPALASATRGAAASYSSATGGSASGTDAVSAATYMGLVGLQGQLSSYADNMNDTTTKKKGLDADAQELQSAIDEWPAGQQTQSLPQVTLATDGSGSVSVTDNVPMTKAQAQDSLRAAKSASESYGNDQQLQSIKLQSMMSSYTNAVNMMSNILKAGYDAGKNTLGNIHY